MQCRNLCLEIRQHAGELLRVLPLSDGVARLRVNEFGFEILEENVVPEGFGVEERSRLARELALQFRRLLPLLPKIDRGLRSSSFESVQRARQALGALLRPRRGGRFPEEAQVALGGSELLLVRG